MKVLINLIKKLFNVVFLLLSPVRRIICRRRRHSDTPILPLTTTSFPTPPAALPPANEQELQSWDLWGVDESQGRNRVKQETPQPELEIDFFQGMAPTIKKPAKILIKKKETDNNENNCSNRLAMNSEFPVTEPELGVWEDAAPSWEEASEDLTWQADATIKEKKRAEREARHMEQQRRKIEKESLRGVKKENTFTAVRLS